MGLRVGEPGRAIEALRRARTRASGEPSPVEAWFRSIIEKLGVGVPILRGPIDRQANVSRILAEELRRFQIVRPGVAPESRVREAAEWLRSMPLVHQTQGPNAVLSWRYGLQSNRRIGEVLRGVILENPTLARQAGLNGGDIARLEGRVGTTFDIDRAAGLDRFVFLHHGVWDGRYGRVVVVVHPAILKPGRFFAGVRDIDGVRVAFEVPREATSIPPDLAQAYRDNQVFTLEDYWRVAPDVRAGEERLGALASMEIKVKNKVPREFILGFVAREYDVAVSPTAAIDFHTDAILRAGIPRERIRIVTKAEMDRFVDLPRGIGTGDAERLATEEAIRELYQRFPTAPPE